MKPYVFFTESGRLGNQFFQYFGIRSYFPEATVFLFGLDEINNFLPENYDPKIYNISCRKLIRYVINKIFIFICNLKLISSAQEKQIAGSHQLIIKKGLFNNIIFIHESYFQSPDLINQMRPAINEEYFQEKVDEWLESNVEAESSLLVFVHVRRGDFLSWPTLDSPAVLNLDWYISAMEFVKEKIPDAVFIICSDDHEYLVDCFGKRSDSILVQADVFFTVGIMASCAHGILSASSLSLMGAIYSRMRSERNGTPAGIFIGPDFWTQHRMGVWHEGEIKVDWIRYI